MLDKITDMITMVDFPPMTTTESNLQSIDTTMISPGAIATTYTTWPLGATTETILNASTMMSIDFYLKDAPRSYSEWDARIKEKDIKDWSIHELEYALGLNPVEEKQKDQFPSFPTDVGYWNPLRPVNSFSTIGFEVVKAMNVTLTPYAVEQMESSKRWIEQHRQEIEGTLALKKLKQ